MEKVNYKKYIKIMDVELVILLGLTISFAAYIHSRNLSKDYSDSSDIEGVDASYGTDDGIGLNGNAGAEKGSGSTAVTGSENGSGNAAGVTGTGGEADDTAEVIASVPGYSISFNPHPVEETKPSHYIHSVDIMVDGERLPSVTGSYLDDHSAADDTGLYNSDNYFGDISFGLGEQYTDVEGIVTFRGNNFRNDPTYGVTDWTSGSMTGMWTVATGALSFEDATWSGSGWTGQPLMQRWSREAKQHMNMYEWAKEKDSLVEVIYACMDGYIYFLDLETGEATRDKLWLGYVFKGAGALDPRGYPILYLGAGYDSAEGHARSFIISLLDCTVLHTFGNDDAFALRGDLSYFDSSALVDAETDTLIYPGENGVLYLIHLGTRYDEKTGQLSLALDRVVKWRYNSLRTTHDKFWPGMETSAAVYQHYLYIADNGGNLLCLDLNTLKPVWVQDILDDSNSTPVLSVENDHLYLYVSTSFHLGWRSETTASVPIWKMDAETGEMIWKTEYTCSSSEGVSGGVQSTIACGRGDLQDYVYVTVAKSHGEWGGDIASLNKSDGSKAWEKQMAYTWSSPVCVYNTDGRGEVVYGASDGNLYVADGHTGEEKSRLKISDGNIEASPAVYNNRLVVGTRAGRICGVLLE